MATETVVKSPQTAAFTDGSFDVAPGDSVVLTNDEATGLYPHEFVTFYVDNGSNDRVAFSLNGVSRIQAISAYAKLIAKKSATTAKVGVSKFSA